MSKDAGLQRRVFLKGAAAGGAAASTIGAASPAAAQSATPLPSAAPPPQAAGAPAGYMFLRPEEAAFVEAMVDTMIPADELSPKGTVIGINVFIDRALASG